MVELAWWEYIIIAISVLFGLLFLNYLVKSLNEGRIEKRLAALEEKSLRNHATEIRTPVLTVKIAKLFHSETKAMGQLFSTGNRPRVTSVINSPRTPSSQVPTQLTPVPRSDTTIIIPLHKSPLEEIALDKHPSIEGPVISQLGNIYNDDAPAFDVCDSSDDLEETPNITHNVEQGQETCNEPVTLLHRDNDKYLTGMKTEEPLALNHSGNEQGEKTSVYLVNGPQVLPVVENDTLPPKFLDKPKVHDEVKHVPKDLITDVPDNMPSVGNKSVFDTVINLAPDVLPRKSLVAITNSMCVSQDKNSKHAILSKNSPLDLAVDAPDHNYGDEDIREWIKRIIVDTL